MADFRVQGKYALLEVVDKRLAPGVNGLLYHLAAVLLGPMGTDQRERLAGGNRYVGPHHGNIPTTEVEADGLEAFANAFGVGRTVEDEEWACRRGRVGKSCFRSW